MILSTPTYLRFLREDKAIAQLPAVYVFIDQNREMSASLNNGVNFDLEGLQRSDVIEIVQDFGEWGTGLIRIHVLAIDCTLYNEMIHVRCFIDSIERSLR